MLMGVDLLLVKGKGDLFIAQGHIFALWVSFPVIGHQDALERRMPGKDNPEHIIRLAFLPVCRWPQASERSHSGIIFGQADPQADPMAIGVREQMVDYLKAWLTAQVINATQIFQK